MKLLSIITAIGFLIANTCHAQIKNAIATNVKVFGNSGICESTIEKSASKRKISKADWNEETHMATIIYDSKRTNIEAILKNIALAGYDNEMFLAPDEAYNNLPGSCKYDRAKKKAIASRKVEDTMSSMEKHTIQQHDSTKRPVQESNQLTAVFDSYFSLKDALVKNDGNLVSAKGLDIQNSIFNVKMEKLPMDVHLVWMKILNDLKEDIKYIYVTKDIIKQREHFMRLSENMYELLKVVNPAETIYYQFCPMANDSKGAYWLSKESSIRNPYYGSQMLTCGQTVETIR